MLYMLYIYFFIYLCLLYQSEWTSQSGTSFSPGPAFESQQMGGGATREEIETVSRSYERSLARFLDKCLSDAATNNEL